MDCNEHGRKAAFALPLALIAGMALLGGCGREVPMPLPPAPLSFTCAAGKSFSVTIDGNHAQVMVDGSRYDLERRRSSIGRKYASGTVTFIEDEDRAVLTGLESGPFRDCRRSSDELRPAATSARVLPLGAVA